MESKEIFVKGAKENNLKNVDVHIPKNSLTVFTGLSGSGKSSLAFDVIFKEGQRLYIESLSSYARQFLGGVSKPDVESIEGLSPAISIDQKTTSHNPRSTVGTVTEIYDYLRLLFARIGVPYCPEHHEPIVAFSIEKLTTIATNYGVGTKLYILSPICKNEKGTHKDVLDKFIKDGFIRFRIDGKIYTQDELPILDKNIRHSIDIVVDRMTISEDSKTRINDDISLALDYSKGYVIFIANDKESFYSIHHTCKYCGFSVPEIEPRFFSFNAPLGSCKDCGGLGIKQEVAFDLIIPDPNLSINEGGIRYFKNIVDSDNLEWQEFELLCKKYKIDLDKPLKDFSKKEMDIIMVGSPDIVTFKLVSSSGNVLNRTGYIEGVKTKIERRYIESNSEMAKEYYLSFMRDSECTTCHGARLSKEALSVLINGKNIYEVCCLTLEELKRYLLDLNNVLDKTQKEIARLILKELNNRVDFLINVGLDYITLARTAMTLSGGESQRIRLATQIGSKLSGVLYVLDEPSIGLHQKDNEKLINSLKQMRDLGNTLIVVEHDEETIRSADYIVDIGPLAGEHGGKVVATGKVEDIVKSKNSLTGDYLAGRKKIETPKVRRKGNGKFIKLFGCTEHNLKNINVDFPLGKFICVSGVSGSGKSTLINDILYKAILTELYQKPYYPGKFKKIEGIENIDKVVHISQEPIGKFPNSNPATYIKVFDDIRAVFAQTIEAKIRGFTKGRFSFNVPGGRCEECRGYGTKAISMNFLPDVYVECDQCHGKKYNAETLEVKYKGKTIFDVLEMTVEEALPFFSVVHLLPS